jgi:hypothetical protein
MGIGRAILPVVDIESARMLSAVEFVNPELLIIVSIYGFVRLLVMLSFYLDLAWKEIR